MIAEDFIITGGDLGAYSALARFHYRAGKPAACVRALTACDRWTGEVVGVLTVSMPTLNGPWRRAAWPGAFALRDKRAMARRVNADLRVISRVVVDPRYRALGVARRLVEAYLADPLTRYTEAIAAMGRWCPFFERAGMREVAAVASRRGAALTQALVDVLGELCVEPWELVDVGRAAFVVDASLRLREALVEWAGYSRATRKHLIGIEKGGEGFVPLAVLAGASLTARPVVYVAEVEGTG